ncbi:MULTISPECIES: hypothetical protein [Micromonospora]|uniref:Uncharacterized protein n=1 Tax=Micromonospora yangpuensis TaxID=683228 RepID=A0A1C6U7E2_9ACTN|nr:hypothetical protein [Micromonospora yangpuensis]GGL90531.1 hypothetical protein GCM10012279_05400 [Micromonospora yangpuensis]SCL49749.1 hypothetical protein GA0070617_1273 [Micromonospora yangpuensis]
MTALTARLRALRHGVTRITLAPLLVRFGIFLTTLAGLVLAYPTELLVGRTLGVLAVVALLPAVSPGRFWPTFAALVTVGGWWLATAGYGRPVALWRLLAVAAALYLAHTLCALAALLPYDAVLDPDVVTRWLTRTAVVLLATSVLGVLLVAVGAVGPGAGFRAVTVAGLLVAVGLSGLLGWLLRRR